MLQMFRNFFKSKFGVGATLALLVLLALAFASSDVANTGMFGGVSGGDRVASVGDERIDASELASRATNSLDRVRQQNPTMTMEGFIASDGLTDTLDLLISRSALAQLAETFGLRAGSRLVDSEITNNPDFRGLDGNFNADTFRNLIRQQGLSEDLVRQDIALGIFAQQLMRPVQILPQMPASIARRYAELGMETRSGAIGALTVAAYAPTGDPTDAQLSVYYQENRADYIRPERRVIRYAVFGEDAFGNIPAPTEAQIAERFQRDAELYAARETRRFTQLVVTTRAAAQAIIDEVNAGTSLEASARSKGLSTTSVPLTDKDDLTEATSAAVANAAFAAARGGLSAPAQGGIGWYIMRVDEVSGQPARTLDQVRGEISTALTEELRRQALNDATARIDDEFSDGRGLTEVAQELGLEITSTRPVTAAGQVYGTQESAPAELAPVLSVAFEMQQSEPQLAETVAGQQFIIYDVSQITRSATAPLAEIRDDVVAAWRRSEGLKAAGLAAARVQERINGGATLAAAIRAENKNLPAVESIRFTRQEIEQARRMTRPLALFFSMAKGTTKALEAPEAGAWIVVQLDDVIAPEVAMDSAPVLQTQQQLRQLLGDEYLDQFLNAARAEVEVETNQAAVDAVAAQLTGRSN